jgi:hypothetical protein
LYHQDIFHIFTFLRFHNKPKYFDCTNFDPPNLATALATRNSQQSVHLARNEARRQAPHRGTSHLPQPTPSHEGLLTHRSRQADSRHSGTQAITFHRIPNRILEATIEYTYSRVRFGDSLVGRPHVCLLVVLGWVSECI